MYAESLLVLRDSFGHFAHVQIFATKIYVGLKISWRQPSTKIESLENLSHEIFFPWKFPRLRILILLNNKSFNEGREKKAHFISQSKGDATKLWILISYFQEGFSWQH